ncbi:MAG: amidohydrolase [Candidatus Korarchaeota archaeon]|nr:amidohydrolase [Thermoproteota archaeon]MCR8463216.1 amidohydrolase [Thermoproteota archaeon]MCR8470853.1 amidohydrolase [Thermoproteota archaeon]MCR8471881.1 amidohydrolase [Thermoproteota archaeon]MCR8473320.1 amidohydrolase [Thermoproteota archaeon]
MVLGIEFIDIRTNERQALGIRKGFFTSPPGKRLDLTRNIVIPAFIDAHSHVINYTMKANWIDLSNVKSKRALLNMIQETLNSRNLFLGYNFDESTWSEREFPTRREVDEVSGNKPVLLLRIDGHLAVVNSGLIEKLKLPENMFKDFGNGIIVEDNVYIVIRKLLSKRKLGPSIKALQSLLKLGIAASADMGSIVEPSDKIKKKLSRCMEVYFYYCLESIERQIQEGLDKTMFKYGGIITGFKLIADGSIGAKTAYLFEPYSDDPSCRGLLLIPEEHLEELIKAANRLEAQLAIHAIGDAAIDVVLNAYRWAKPGLRHRIEHFEMPHDDHIDKLAKCHIIPSMQPNFIANWQQRGGLYEQRLGWERAKRMNPLATILAKAGLIAFGSDNMPSDPLYGIYGAMTHPIESERLRFAEAVQCYTTHAAYSIFAENKLGELREGYVASFLALESVDIHNPKEVRNARIQQLFVRGKKISCQA